MKIMITSANYGMDYEGLCVKDFEAFTDFVNWKKSLGMPVVLCENHWMEGYANYDELVENYGQMAKDIFEAEYQAIVIDNGELEEEILTYYLK